MKSYARNFEQTDDDSPWKYGPADWWAVVKRTVLSAQHDNVSVIAAGVAFFSLLATFPLISAALSTFSYFADPGDVSAIASDLARLLPGEASAIIESQIMAVLDAEAQKIGFGILIPLVLALFSAGAGIRAMMRAMNVAYEEVESRSIVAFYTYATLMTIGSLVFVWISLLVIVGVPAALNFINLDGTAEVFARILPWVLLVTVFCFACGIMYRFGPSRRPARKRYLLPGIAFAMISWIVISYGFSRFVSRFSTYNETFGSLASVVILLVWLWLTANAVILGAELNAELERQTIADTTRGPGRPIGRRGAVMADYVALETPDAMAMTEVVEPTSPEEATPESMVADPDEEV